MQLKQRQKLWNDYDELQEQIEMHGENEEVDVAITANRAAFEDSFFKIVAISIIEVNIPNQSTANVNSCVSIFPVSFKIVLPIFSGHFDEFMTFHDSFKALVHKNPFLLILNVSLIYHSL